MGAFDALRRIARTGSPEIASAQQMSVWSGWTLHDEVMGMGPAEIWRTQPHLRTVVSFLARNIAQCGLQVFVRTGENDRERVRDGALAQVLRRPNPQTTSYELIFGLVADWALYDVAYLHFAQDASAPSGWVLWRLNPDWVTPMGGDAFGYAGYRVRVNGGTDSVDLPAESVLDFHGWNPGDARKGSSPIAALKAILAEQVMAVKYRQQVWERGGRVSAVITRPAGNAWSDEARKGFREDWNAKYVGDGSNVGGTPILEDGMTINRLDFNPRENQFVEAAKLALAQVATAYHVNPTMVGLLDNANFSNVREFRKMLYGDTLGPIFNQFEDRLNTFLVPLLDSRDGVYVEFNIGEKLSGNFEEQTAAIQSAVGRPWMTADEARGKFNLPALGGDAEQIVTPLNVLVGGQASPRDGQTAGGGGATQAVTQTGDDQELDDDVAKAVRDSRLRSKSDAKRFKSEDLIPETYPTKAEEVLRAFFARQAEVVLKNLRSKDDEFWDSDRWDKELADDLYRLAATTSKEMGERQAEALGFAAGDYDVDRTLKFLRAVAESRAGAVNSTTLKRLKESLDAGDDPAAVFEEAEADRSKSGGTALMTALAGFALTEAAKQTTGDAAEKTWVVNSRNPRGSHAEMDGETVPIGDTFSNGAEWPGDPVLGAEGVANCQCTTDILLP